MYYRQILQNTGKESAPLPGSASAASVQSNAQAILQAAGGENILHNDPQPVQTINPVANGNTATEVMPVANQAVVNPAGSGSQLIAWVKQNPLVAAGMAVGAWYLITELMKGGKK